MPSETPRLPYRAALAAAGVQPETVGVVEARHRYANRRPGVVPQPGAQCMARSPCAGSAQEQHGAHGIGRTSG